MSNTTWTPKAELLNSFSETLRSLESRYDSIGSLLSKELYPLEKDTYHLLAQVIRSKSREEHALLSHIMNMAYRNEILSQGSGVLTFRLAMAFTKYLMTHRILDNPNPGFLADVQKEISELKGILSSKVSPGTQEHLERGLSEICQGDRVLLEVARQAIYLAGLEGKIFTENGKQPNYIVEQKTGFTFKCKPYKFFLTHSTWSAANCKVLTVDGFLEKVSEIDGLLQQCHALKQPMVIIATGFSEEVVATLKANQERNNFECLPIRIVPDVETLNVINDVSVVAGMLPVSSLKGDLLCFVKFEDLPCVEHIEVHPGDMTIQNAATARAVSAQVRSLMEKRNDNFAVEDVQNQLDLRLKSLVSNSVVISLPDTSKINTDSKRVVLDNAFRFAKSAINHGFVRSQDFLSAVGEKDTPARRAIGESLTYALKGKEWVPALSVLAILQVGLSGLSTILSAGGMVKLISEDSSSQS